MASIEISFQKQPEQSEEAKTLFPAGCSGQYSTHTHGGLNRIDAQCPVRVESVSSGRPIPTQNTLLSTRRSIPAHALMRSYKAHIVPHPRKATLRDTRQSAAPMVSNIVPASVLVGLSRKLEQDLLPEDFAVFCSASKEWRTQVRL